MMADAPVVVMGMHRSGTSMVASMLGELGLDFGPADRLMPAKADNPEGFWENLDIVQLNDDLLAALGGSWIDPPILGDGWQERPDLAEYRSRAEDILQGWGSTGRYAFKDPRLSITLPLWRFVIGDIRTVLVLRGPRRVAQSLAAREAIDFDAAENLWLRYTASALHAAPDAVLVDYERLIASPNERVGALAEALDLDHSIEDAIAAIKPGLHHHREGAEESGSATDTWYRLLRDQPELGRSLVPILHAGNVATYANDVVRKDVVEVVRQRESALLHRDEMMKERDDARQGLDAMVQQRDTARNRADDLSEEVEHVRTVLSERIQIVEGERDHAREAHRTMREQRDKAMKALERERSETKARVAVLEAERAAAQRQRDEATQERDRFAREFRRAQSALDRAQRHLSARLASARRRISAALRRGLTRE